ncbi:MAG: carbohydrate ABC transporter permease [Chloroflexota bacterium]
MSAPAWSRPSLAPGRRRRFPWPTLLFYVVILPVLLTWLVPLFAAVLTSLRTLDDLIGNGPWRWPDPLVWSNFPEAWSQGGLSRYMANSFIITIPALIATLLLSSMAAFALARFRFRGNLAIYFLFVAGTLLPYQILMLPVFRLSNRLGLYDTYWALIVFHTAFQLGFCTFVLRNFMTTIPGEIFDAARIDGAGEWRIFRQHALPLSLPSLAALATLEFTWIFNDYLWALILVQQDRLKPVTTGLASLMGEYQRSWNVLFAGTLIAVIPTVLLFIFLQRYFIQGLTMGSGK